MRAKRSESVAKAFACCADLPTRSNTNRCPLAIDCAWDSPLLVPPSERISRIGSIRKLRGYPQLRGDGFVCNLPRRRREGAHRVGEKQNQPFQISFDASLKDNLQGPTSNFRWWSGSGSRFERAGKCGEAYRRTPEQFTIRLE